MTTYYVGSGGNNANAGTSWALRKATLNGAEDIPLVAGDTVYVGPGTYRELLTLDVSGTNGNPITYIGDYTGANTDGVGGVVRITGSDNDQTAARANCITGTSRNYRTFQNLYFDGTSGTEVNNAGGTNWIITGCYFAAPISNAINLVISGAAPTNCTIQNCFFFAHASNNCVSLSHTSVVDNVGHVFQNCVFAGGTIGIQTIRVGGFTIKNSVFWGRLSQAIAVTTAITVGQTIAVNNCIFYGNAVSFAGSVSGEIVEDYNTISATTTPRQNTATGANSLTYPPLFDGRWFFQLVTEGAGPDNTTQVVSPFDLASFSALLNVAGTSPSTTDMRGTAIQGAAREWGAFEYDSTLKIEGGSAAAGVAGVRPVFIMRRR